MSILGIIGKVAKAGLGVVTGGVSDKILAAAKGLSQAKKAVTKTNQATAKVAKIAGKQIDPVPVLKQARVGGRRYGTSRPAKRVTYSTQSTSRSSVKKKVTKKKVPAVKATKAPKAKSTTKRAPPKGGLDLKRMSAAWNAAGKPGTWQGWIKSNPLKTK